MVSKLTPATCTLCTPVARTLSGKCVRLFFASPSLSPKNLKSAILSGSSIIVSVRSKRLKLASDMKLTIDVPPQVAGGIQRYASDKGGISWESAVVHLLIRALAHFGYL